MEWRELHPQYEINPMDYVGELHNTLLEHFIKNIDNVSKKPCGQYTVVSDAINLILPEAISLLQLTSHCLDYYKAYAACTAAVVNNHDSHKDFLQDAAYSSGFHVILSKILNIIEQLTIDNVDVSLNSLQKIDIDIFAIGLSAFEKDTIWMMNSIARHSSAYWVSAKNDPDSPWINVLSDRGCDFLRKELPELVFTDIKAAFIGAWFAANPLAALGASAVSTAVDAITEYEEDNEKDEKK